MKSNSREMKHYELIGLLLCSWFEVCLEDSTTAAMRANDGERLSSLNKSQESFAATVVKRICR